MTARGEPDREARDLPEGFEPLASWIPKWVREDSQARSDVRQESSFAELHAFYDAMLPYAESALAHLAKFSLGALAPPEERLLKLMLALAEVAPAIEWYGQAKVVDGLPAARFPAVEPLADNKPQTRAAHP